jgi:hypothetical protein
MKYVVLSVEHAGGITRELPFAFPTQVVHKHFADTLIALLKVYYLDAVIIPVSAGELTSYGNEFNCTGLSESMNGLKSREEVDDALFHMIDYGGGIS